MTLDQKNQTIFNRILSAEIDIASAKFKTGDLEEYEKVSLYNQLGKISKSPIYISDKDNGSIGEICGIIRKLRYLRDIQLAVVDYFDLIDMSDQYTFGIGNSEEDKMDFILRELKRLARELNIPIIVLSQLDSKRVSTPGNKPLINHIKSSLQTFADMILLIYRFDYYRIDVDEFGRDLRNIIEVDVAKNKNGCGERFYLKLDKSNGQVSNVTMTNDAYI